MNMVDALYLRITLKRNGIEAEFLALDREGRFQRTERLHRGFRSQMLVPIENNDVIVVANRNDRAREAAFRPGRSRSFLTFDRVAVDVGTRIAMDSRNEVGGNSLRNEIIRQRKMWVRNQRATRREHLDPRHALDPAADDDIRLAGH